MPVNILNLPLHCVERVKEEHDYHRAASVCSGLLILDTLLGGSLPSAKE